MVKKTLVFLAIGVLVSFTILACKETEKATPTAAKPTTAATTAVSPTTAATSAATATKAATIAATTGATAAATTAATTVATAAATKAAAGDATKGKATFSGAGCTGCHGANGEGGVGPKLTGTKLSASDITDIVRKGKGIMPAFSKDKVSDDDLNNVIAYIQSLK